MSDVKAVRYLLANNAPLNAQVPAVRVIGGVLPQGIELPAISVTHVSTVRPQMVNAASKLCVSRVQVTVMAASYATQNPKRATTLYASDRDMFVFLADEKNRIEFPNRRNGEPGLMARGFFIWNSEVGSSTFGVSTFLFDYVCCNRIVWGATQYSEVRVRHTAGAADRWLEEVVPAIETYANSSTANVVKAIEDARAKRIDNVDAFLASRFTRSQASAIQAAHMSDEQRPIENLWDAATGITAYARGVQYQDERVDLERKAGKVLELAA